ncbi:MAG: PAS domain-containing protein [Dongiaceae bacterium]
MAQADKVPRNLQAMSDYWHGLAGGATPARDLLEPRAIKPLLPYVLLVELESRPFRVRYRLTGTAVDAATGLCLTGHYLDEFTLGKTAEAVEQLHDRYKHCSESGQPSLGYYNWPSVAGYPIHLWFGLFPLKVAGLVRQCLAIEDYGNLSGAGRLSRWDGEDIDYRDTRRRAVSWAAR